MAACTPVFPSAGATITCTGANGGYSSSLNNITFVINAGGSVNSPLLGIGTALQLSGNSVTFNNAGTVDPSLLGLLSVLSSGVKIGNSGTNAINISNATGGVLRGTTGLLGVSLLSLDGMALNVQNGAGTTTINNAGTISSSGLLGVTLLGGDAPVVAAWGGAQINMTNAATGKIIGRVAFEKPTTGGNTFYNAGEIVGSVSMGQNSTNTFTAVTGSSVSSGGGVGLNLAGLVGVNLGFAATGIIDGGAGGNNTLVLNNPTNTGSSGTGTISSANYINFNKLTLNSGTWTLQGPVVSNTSILNGGLAQFDSVAAFGSGLLTSNGGSILALNNGLTLGNQVTLGTGGLTVQGANNLTLGGVVGGTGPLIKSGTGTLSLNGTNTYTGGTSLGGGGLSLGNGAALGTGLLTVTGASSLDSSTALTVGNNISLGANLSVAGTNALALGGILSGTGQLTKNGTANLTLNGANTWQGGTQLNGGSLKLGNASALGTGALTVVGAATLDNAAAYTLNNAVHLGADLSIAGLQALTLGGVIDGTGALIKNGAANLTLSGNNAGFTGPLSILAGTVTTASAGALGNSSGANIATGAALNLGNNASLGSLTGTGGVNIGTGNTLTLGGTSASSTFGGVISGAGGLTKSGSGVLGLTGANTLTGTTLVSGGTLNVGGSLASDNVNVNSGATLAGTGLLTGAVNIANGAHLAATSGSTLNVGSLVLGSSANLDAGLGAPSSTGLIKVNGSLTLDGNLNVTDVGGFGTGVYRLIDYTGSLSDLGLNINSIPANVNLADLTVQTGANGQVNLVVAGSNSSVRFWDGAQTAANGIVDGGAGTWAAGTTNWTSVNGTQNQAWASDFGVFQGTAGAVSVVGNQSFNGLQFVTDGYSLNAGTGGRLTAVNGSTGNTSIRVDPNVTATVGVGIVGSGTLNKQDAGTLVLNGANTYTGGTLLNGGKLVVGNTTALGTGQLTAATGTTLDSNTAISLGNAINLAGNLAVGGTNNLNLSGVISGAGGLIKNGLANLTLAGNNTFSGLLDVQAGSVTTQSANALANVSGANVASGAQLNLGNSTSLNGISGAGSVQMGAGNALTIGATNLDSVFSGVLTGAGTLIKAGTGTLALSGSNTMSGAAQVNAGTLNVNGSLANSTVAVANGATLGGTGSLSGAVNVADGGHLKASTGSTLSLGSLVLSNNANLDVGLAAPVNGGGTRLFNVGGNLTLDGKLNVTDIGGFGVGVYRLIDYTGSLTNLGLDIGSLPVGVNLGDLAVQTGVNGQINLVVSTGTTPGTIRFWDGSNTTGNGSVDGGSGTWSSAGNNWTSANGALNQLWANDFAVFQGTAGTVTVAGPQTFNGLQFLTDGYVLNAGALGELAAVNGSGGYTAVRVDPNVTATLNVGITGAATLNKLDSGTLVLNGLSTYTGGTQLTGGTLVVGNDGALGVGALTAEAGTNLNSVNAVTLNNAVNLNGNLGIGTPSSLTLNGLIGGAGGLTKNDTGVLTLNGLNTFSGGTTLNSGTLVVGNGAALGTGALSVVGNATLDNSAALALGNAMNLGANLTVAGSNDLTLGGALNGTGSLIKNGGSLLRLTGTNGLTGDTQVNAGTLDVAGSLASANVGIATGATLTGNGSLLGAVNIADGGHLSASSGNTLSVGSLLLNGNSNLDVGLGAPSTGGTRLINVNGNLTLDGKLNVTDVGGFGVGVYRLMDYSGSLTDLGIDISSIPANVNLADLAVQTGVNGQVNLVVNGDTGTIRFWDGSQTVANAAVDGGNGVWGSGTNWTSANGLLNQTWSSDFGVFQGTAGTVTVEGNQSFTGLQFVTDGYNLVSGTNGQLTALNGANGNTAIRVDPNVTATLGVGIGGAGTLNKLDSGTLVLNGANSYSGGTQLNGGTLVVGSNTALGVSRLTAADGTTLDSNTSVALGNAITLSGNLTVAGSQALALNGDISGAGGLIKNGLANLTLGGNNSYLGPIALNAGGLILASNTALGSGALNVSGNATLDTVDSTTAITANNAITLAGNLGIGGTSDLTLNGVVSGSGSLTKNGAAQLILDRSNIYSGGTTLNAGGLLLGDGTALGTGALTVGGTSTLDTLAAMTVNNAINLNSNLSLVGSNDLNLAGVVSGAGGLTKSGNNTLTLSGTNTFSGPLDIQSGTLSTTSAASLGNTSGANVASGALLDLGSSLSLNSLSGAGGVQLGSGNTLSLGGNSASSTFDGVINGGGNLIKAGNGSLNLTGVNGLSGDAQVNGGTLNVEGSLASANVAVGSGATLTGIGSLAGAVSVANGGHLAGSTGNTLSMGALTLASGSQMDVALGAPTATGGPELFRVGGNLVLDGDLNVTDAGGFGVGVYRLIDYTGSLSDLGLNIATLAAGVNLADLSVQTGVNGQVNLVLSSQSSNLLFWDGSNTVANNAVDGGNGTWSATNTNWTSANGTVNQAWGNDFAVFQGAAGTVTVDGNQNFGGLQFSSNYSLINGTNGQLTTADTGNGYAAVRVDPNVTATLGVNLAGTVALNKLDSGTLVLSGNNSHSGGTLLNGGTLVVGSDSALGVGELTAVTGTTLDSNAPVTLGNAVNLNGDLAIGGSNGLTLNGIVSGAGRLIKNGLANLTLGGNNSYLGPTALNAGGLILASNTALSSGPLNAAANTTLDASTSVIAANDVTLAGNLNIGGTADLALGGIVSGAGGLTKNGVAQLTLNGVNTYTGGTTLNSGALNLGNGAALGTGALNVAGASTLDNSSAISVGNGINLGADLTVLGSHNLTLSGPINNGLNSIGNLIKDGTSTLTLAGASGFTGNTQVTGGTLNVTGSLDSSNVGVASGATLAGTGTLLGGVNVASGGHLNAQSNQTLTVGSLVLNSGSNLDVGLAAPSTGGTRLINVNGDLSLNGNLNVVDIGGFGLGVYRLIDYSGVFSGAGLTIGSIPGNVNASDLLVQTGVNGQVNLVVSGAGGNLQFWDGSQVLPNGTVDGGAGTWDATNTHWTNANGTVNTGWGGGFAVFQGTAGTVTVNGTQNVTGLQFLTDGYALVSGNNGQLNAASGTLAVRVDPNVTATLGLGIDGAATLNKLDAGTLVLNGANTYSGGTSLDGGTLVVGNNGALGTGTLTAADGTSLGNNGNVTLGNDVVSNGALSVDATNTFVLNGDISGTGSLIKNGAGSLLLNGNNAYQGGTTLNVGTLVAGSDGALGIGALTVAGASTLSNIGGVNLANNVSLLADLMIAGTGNLTLSGTVDGAGKLIKNGTSDLSLGGNNTWTGGTDLNAGRLIVNNTQALGTGALTVGGVSTLINNASAPATALANNVNLGANLTVDGVNDLALSGVISGVGGLIKNGLNDLTLSGTNTFTGPLSVVAGNVFTVGNSALGNTSAVNVAAGAGLNLGGDASVGGLAGAGGVTIGNGATLTVGNNNLASTFDGSLAGTGQFTKSGLGTLTLTGINSLSGDTLVNGGTLNVTGSLASGNVQVNNGAALAGTGSLAGAVNISNGGHLEAAQGTTLSVGSLVMGANSNFDVGLGAPSPAGLVSVGGNLTLDGNLNVTDVGGFGVGVYRLIDYTGSLTDLGLDIARIPAGVSLADLQVQTSVGNQVNLVYGNATANINFWDGTQTAPNNSVDGGAGIWGAGNTNWTTADGSQNGPWAGEFAVFQGTAGDVTVQGNQTFNGMQFSTDGYHLLGGQGNSLTAVAALNGNTSIRVDPGVTAIIDTLIDGTSPIAKLDTGTLVLNGANTYSGGTSLQGGTLIVGNDSALGSGVLTAANGTTLDTNADVALGNGIVLNGGLNIGGSNALTLDGTISGTGGLIKNGPAALTLNGDNLYQGATTLKAGSLIVGSDSALGSGPLNTADGTTLDSSTAVTLANDVNLGGGLTVAGTSGLTLSGVVGGNGRLIKNGVSRLVLNRLNTYTGGTRLNGGTLVLGNAGALGSGALTVGAASTLDNTTPLSLANDVTLADSLTVGGSQNLTLAGVISGAGSLIKTGLADLTLSGNNTFTGLIDILSGSLTSVGAGALGNNAGINLASGAALNLSGSANLGGLSGDGNVDVASGNTLTVGGGNASSVFDGVLSGPGTFVKDGAGTLSLTGANTHSGDAVIKGGTLNIRNLLASRTVAVKNGGTLSGTGSVLGDVTVEDGGHLAASTPDTFTLGSLALAPNALFDVSLGAPVAGGGNALVNINGNLTLDGTLNVTDIGGFGSGVYRLMRYNGALINNGLAIGTLPGGVSQNDLQVQTAVANQVNLLVATSGTTVQFWDGGQTTPNGTVDGGSGVWNAGSSNWTSVDGLDNNTWKNSFAVFMGAPGTVTVEGSQSITGLQFVTDGYVLDQGAGGELNAVNGSTGTTAVRVDPNVTATLNTVINGNGTLNKLDSGTLVLNGANGYTGGTSLDGGALVVGNDTALGSGVLTAADGTALGNNAAVTLGNGIVLNGALAVGGLSPFTLAGNISGAGSLIKNDANTLTLTGTNSWQGGTQLNAGTLLLGNDGALGSGALNVAGAGTLDSSGALNLANAIQLGGSLTLAGNQATTLNGVISGTSSLIKNGTGALLLTGANTYSGGTTLNGGSITGDTTSLQGSILNNAALTFAQNADGTYAGSLSGNGSLIKSGTGVLLLTGNSAFTGTTDVQAGALRVDGSLNSASVNVASGATLGGGGQINGAVQVNSGATLTAGSSATPLSLGSLALASGSTLDFALGLPGSSTTAVNVGGDLTLGGTLNISNAGGFGTGVYRLFRYGGNLTNNGLNYGALPTGTAAGDLSLQTSMANQVNLLVASDASELQFWNGSKTSADGAIGGGDGVWGADTNWTDATGTLSLPTNARFAVFGGWGGVVNVEGNQNFTGLQFLEDGYTLTSGSGGTLTPTNGTDGSPAPVRVDSGVTTQIAASLVGAAGIEKLDAGTLWLTGPNTYSGGTTVSGGMLAGNTSSLQGNIRNNARLLFAQVANGRFNGTLSGNGELIKQGAGTLLLTGAQPFSGSVAVNEGTLQVGASDSPATLGGQVAVADGAALVGNGSVAGLSNNGLVQSGGETGNLGVTGNFTNGPTGRLRLLVNAASFSPLAVGGVTTLGGTLQVVPLAPFTGNTRYTLLTSTGGINGTFNALDLPNYAFLDTSVSYAPNAVNLDVTRNQTRFTDVADTPNQQGVAGAVGGPQGNGLQNEILNMSSSGARAAFDNLSGEIFASTTSAMIEDSHYVRDALTERMRQPGCYREDDPRNALVTSENRLSSAGCQNEMVGWMRVLGSWGEAKGDSNTAKLDHNVSGFMLGTDKQIDDQWRVGAAAGYTRSDLNAHDRHSTASVDSYHLAAYMNYQLDTLAARFGAVYSWHDIESKRDVSVGNYSDRLKAKYDARTAQVFGEVGYTLEAGGVSFEPFAGLAHVDYDSDRAKEKGGIARLSADSDQNMTFSTVGVRAGKRIQLGKDSEITPRGSIGWRHAYGDTKPDADLTFINGGASFSTQGVPIARDAAVVEAGLDFQVGEDSKLGIGYSGQLSKENKDHAMTISFSMGF
ncbi:autotransporter-associated beta strand repeat-containing protein [Pseudomonas sp. NPDC088368]|uniref:autotransporter-associated beta strand repeat-containing protein n=1 Tax=Pseudomonas sp. NPDC088368 TaxID=3364453 RepID=UPI003813D23F